MVQTTSSRSLRSQQSDKNSCPFPWKVHIDYRVWAENTRSEANVKRKGGEKKGGVRNRTCPKNKKKGVLLRTDMSHEFT